MAIIEAVILLVMLLIVANIIGHYVPRLPVSNELRDREV